jgi:hypothetical protein
LEEPPVRAIGTAPERHGSVRYLVPVLEGSGIQLLHMPRRFEGGHLVNAATGKSDGASGTGADGSPAAGAAVESVTPVLGGSLLSTAAPSPAPERLLARPSLIDGSELADGAPALLVRRSAPHRIVFGVRPDPAWNLGTNYLPVLDDGVIALSGRHQGRVGLAVSPPPDLDEEALDRVGPSGAPDGQPSESGPSWPWPITVAIGAALVLGAGVWGVARARARRRA